MQLQNLIFRASSSTPVSAALLFHFTAQGFQDTFREQVTWVGAVK